MHTSDVDSRRYSNADHKLWLGTTDTERRSNLSVFLYIFINNSELRYSGNRANSYRELLLTYIGVMIHIGVGMRVGANFMENSSSSRRSRQYFRPGHWYPPRLHSVIIYQSTIFSKYPYEWK